VVDVDLTVLVSGGVTLTRDQGQLRHLLPGVWVPGQPARAGDEMMSAQPSIGRLAGGAVRARGKVGLA
jgi:hypothetical protein